MVGVVRMFGEESEEESSSHDGKALSSSAPEVGTGMDEAMMRAAAVWSFMA